MTSGRSIVLQGDIERAEEAVVFLPPAGSVTSPYFPLGGLLPPGLPAVHCELPGRGRLVDERPVGSVREAADRWSGELARALPGRRLHLFGHSLGSLFAYETAARFTADPVCRIASLTVSAAREPGHTPRAAIGAAFAALSRQRRGTDADGDADGDRLATDLRIRREYRPHREPLAVPLALLCGRDDTFVRPEEMPAWREFVTGRFLGLFTFDGGHDYYLARPDPVASVIERITETSRNSTRTGSEK
ncbi:thioesterase II family protein [Streptomyces rubellomurinus]|uniref:Alpha/beta fold hydrolase n=1 Tax=Streptomyces sp. Y1 TaxID=3238634 RepID=A0AB39TTV9_9ACTN|nr:alpha/beta fold hydrolase [Streptomyces rubellomurinus]